MLSMLNTLHDTQHQADIHWLHAAENGTVHAFADEVANIADNMPNLSRHLWYRSPQADDQQGRDYDSEGLMDLSLLPTLLAQPQTHYYFCGPLAFMQAVGKQLLEMGVPTAQIHYECFGPHKVV